MEKTPLVGRRFLGRKNYPYFQNLNKNTGECRISRWTWCRRRSRNEGCVQQCFPNRFSGLSNSFNVCPPMYSSECLCAFPVLNRCFGEHCHQRLRRVARERARVPILMDRVLRENPEVDTIDWNEWVILDNQPWFRVTVSSARWVPQHLLIIQGCVGSAL